MHKAARDTIRRNAIRAEVRIAHSDRHIVSRDATASAERDGGSEKTGYTRFMHFIRNFIFHVLANGAAFFLAERLISSFLFTGTYLELFLTATALALVNTFIRPIVKLLLSPLIIITLGLFIIVINAGLLYILDIFIEPLTIQGLIPLLLTTLLVSAFNIVVNMVIKFSK
jgi:putative membrane protein